MESATSPRTMGVVVLHRAPYGIGELPAVRDLADQVDELLIVHNGPAEHPDDTASGDGDASRMRSIRFDTNRGTAAAWNAALDAAADAGCRYLYILDQDSVPSHGAVASALAEVGRGRIAAVVQPAARDRLGLDPFPWNTVASGSLLDVPTLRSAGGFDERLFVDEVDHELFARLIRSGHAVVTLPAPTIRHRTGSPRHIRFLGRDAVVSGHGSERRRLQGFSAGLLVRRFARAAPATSARLLLRHALTAVKDVVGGDTGSASALAAGLVGGAGTGDPPAAAARRACPYCGGPLLGRFRAVPDWRFHTGVAGDLYRCGTCGALAAGRVPDEHEIASWYEGYYTHAAEPPGSPVWARVWPTPRRRRELERLHWYFADPRGKGRFLEVGTGSGERLVQFADAGWDVVGQDPDPKAGHAARARGITVHGCPVEELVGREEPFDLIGLSHVLEHATDPAGLLHACASLLAPGGRLCVVCPNADSLGRRLFGRWWYGLDQPRHLAIPTLDSLARVTSSLGLDLTCAESAATNAAVILGGSLERALEQHVANPHVRAGAQFLLHALGQGLGRAATFINPRLGEEVVWVGVRPGSPDRGQSLDLDRRGARAGVALGPVRATAGSPA